MLRLLKNTDYINFLNLINKFRNTYFTEVEFKTVLEKLENNNTFIWVYEYNNKLISTAKLIIETKFIFNISYVGHIEDVFVEQEYRQKNIGKTIILKLIEQAIQKKCYKIICVCNNDNKIFYEKCGLENRGSFMSKLLN